MTSAVGHELRSFTDCFAPPGPRASTLTAALRIKPDPDCRAYKRSDRRTMQTRTLRSLTVAGIVVAGLSLAGCSSTSTGAASAPTTTNMGLSTPKTQSIALLNTATTVPYNPKYNARADVMIEGPCPERHGRWYATGKVREFGCNEPYLPDRGGLHYPTW